MDAKKINQGFEDFYDVAQNVSIFVNDVLFRSTFTEKTHNELGTVKTLEDFRTLLELTPTVATDFRVYVDESADSTYNSRTTTGNYAICNNVADAIRFAYIFGFVEIYIVSDINIPSALSIHNQKIRFKGAEYATDNYVVRNITISTANMMYVRGDNTIIFDACNIKSSMNSISYMFATNYLLFRTQSLDIILDNGSEIFTNKDNAQNLAIIDPSFFTSQCMHMNVCFADATIHVGGVANEYLFNPTYSGSNVTWNIVVSEDCTIKSMQTGAALANTSPFYQIFDGLEVFETIDGESVPVNIMTNDLYAIGITPT